MRYFAQFLAIAALALAAVPGALFAADANCFSTASGKMVCPAPDSRCVTDRRGEVVCSSPGGGVAFDRYGEPTCGQGYCTQDIRGDVFCSSQPRGAASTDRFGNAACAGQCVPASGAMCVRPRAGN